MSFRVGLASMVIATVALWASTGVSLVQRLDSLERQIKTMTAPGQ